MLDIKTKAEELLVQERSNAEIVEIFKTGSQIFKDNPKDLDYVIVCKNYEKQYSRIHLTHEDQVYDLIFRDEDYYYDLLSFNLESIDEGYIHNLLFNYFVCFRDVIYGSWDLQWDILVYKDIYLNYIKAQYANTIGKRINRSKITKGWVHYYIILKIFDNNKVEITEEMLQDINTLYSSTEGTEAIIQWIEDRLAQ